MSDFIDLMGASGVAYRFRLWPEGAAHPPAAGNYVIVRRDGGGLVVLLIGATDDLSEARADWRKVAKKGATHVYTRLNISRGARMAEHQDLVSAHPTSMASEGV